MSTHVRDPRPGPPLDPAPSRNGLGTRERAAIALLLLGGFIAGVGWIAGVVLLWDSRAWSAREKWLGTLVVPGGWATAFLVALLVAGNGESCHAVRGAAPVCSGGPSPAAQVLQSALSLFLLAGPPLAAVVLARRAKAPPPVTPRR